MAASSASTTPGPKCSPWAAAKDRTTGTSCFRTSNQPSISPSTGLTPNEIHTGRLPRLRLSIFDSFNIGGQQSLDRDHPAYCNLATERQKRVYRLVREHHAVTASRLAHRNSPIMYALRLHPLTPWAAGLGSTTPRPQFAKGL